MTAKQETTRRERCPICEGRGRIEVMTTGRTVPCWMCAGEGTRPVQETTVPRAPVEHDVKCWPPYFGAVAAGEKPFEVRQADRDYRVGDVLLLREWRPDWRDYTGRIVRRRITYRLDGGAFGVEQGACVLGLAGI